MLLRSIAKSVVKPIFSPPHHPSFFAPKSPFFALFPVLDSISGDFSRNALVLSPTSDDFSRNISRFSLRLPHFQFMLPHPLHYSPLSFSFLPTFPSPSPINTRTRTPSRTTRVRVHPPLPARQEVFVYCLHRFTTPRNPLCTNALGVKKNKKKPSQNTQSSHNQYISTKHPIPSAVNSIYHRGELHPSSP